MRKLFQSKLAVSVMVIGAILLVGWRVKTYGQPGFLQGFAREAEAVVPPLDLNQDLTLIPSSKEPEGWPDYRTNLLNWVDLFPVTPQSRDPFATADPDWESVADRLNSDSLPGVADLILQAISIQPGHALVVINQQTLGLGEKVGEFVVENIRAHEVWLKHPQGRHILSLKFGVTEKPMVANASQASE